MKIFKPLNQDGLTIVELIITIAVGALLASTTTMIVISQTTLSQRARDTILAGSFAETKIEQIRSEGYNVLVTSATPIDITSELPSELNEPRSSSYTVSNTTQDGLKRIDLTIVFNDQGDAKTLNYRTYVGELGVGQY